MSFMRTRGLWDVFWEGEVVQVKRGTCCVFSFLCMGGRIQESHVSRPIIPQSQTHDPLSWRRCTDDRPAWSSNGEGRGSGDKTSICKGHLTVSVLAASYKTPDFYNLLLIITFVHSYKAMQGMYFMHSSCKIKCYPELYIIKGIHSVMMLMFLLDLLKQFSAEQSS